MQGRDLFVGKGHKPCIFLYYMTLMEFTVDGIVCDFCVTLYSSVKPFVQQAYPIQPSVTAPISGNSSIYILL